LLATSLLHKPPQSSSWWFRSSNAKVVLGVKYSKTLSYSRIPAIRNPLIRNLVLEFGQFHDEIAFFLITDCGTVAKSRNQASARLPK